MPQVSQISDTKFTAIIEGGPQLATALDKLDDKIRKQAARDALQGGGVIIADAWSALAPVGQPPDDPHPGAYRRSLAEPDAVRSRATVNGASATVSPALLYDLPFNQQPWIYAPVLEFGDADREAEPSARPAFDASVDNALGVIAALLAQAIE